MESCLHPEMFNWDFNDEHPIDRATFLKRIKDSSSQTKTISYDIKPVAIRIVGNVAIVHGYYRDVEEDAKAQRTESRSRWMDELVKKGGKWLMLGGHGGVLKK